MSDAMKGSTFVAVLTLATSPLLAATYTVTSISELQSRIDNVAGGDTIVVQDGTYTTSGAITLNRTFTSGAPLTIKAQTVGGVTINGSAGFSVQSPAAYITVQGFRLLHSGA